MAKKQTEADKKLLEQALERYNISSEFYKEDYQRNEEDVKFAMGEQWEETVLSQRKGRPCLTENRLLPFVNKTVNEIRQARPSVVVKPVDSGADIETADILRGIIRNIESQSDAETAYDTAAKNAISAGYGWVRVNTQYVDNSSFDQEVIIERVLNPFSVLGDPSSQRMDGCDMEYLFIYDDMDKDAFEEAYPDAVAEGFEIPTSCKEWLSDDKIRVAEYFYKEYSTETLYRYILNGELGIGKELPEGAEELESREVDVPKIKYCKITAGEILEKTEFAGQFIPVVPVVGMESFLDGKRQIFSLINQAKDPQRMFNYWKSCSTETIALQPKAPFIAAYGQIDKDNANEWANANSSNIAVLQYKPVIKDGVPMPPPSRQAPPTNSGTMMQEAMAASDGIKASLGMYDASMGQQTADISGKAIISRQMQGDLSTFHFVDNLSTGMKQVGRVLVDLIPKVYNQPQIVRINGEDGVERSVAINQPATKQGQDLVPMQAGQEQDAFHKLDAGKYDVVVEVGASYATKRQEAANSIIELSRANPAILEVAGDLLVKNLDIPNAETIAKRIQATMDPSLLGDDVEGERLQQQAEQIQMLTEKLEQTELALQVKDEDVKFNQTLEMGKLNNETQKLNIEAQYKKAQIDKLNAEANIEIPAEAMKDMVEAGAETEQFMENMMLEMNKMQSTINELTSKGEEVATGEPTKTPEIEIEISK